jgi:hypothetical protein
VEIAGGGWGKADADFVGGVGHEFILGEAELDSLADGDGGCNFAWRGRFARRHVAMIG